MRKIHNEQGSVLVITTAMVLIFTMMGLATTYMAGQQNVLAEKQRASDEAFWLADGAVQQVLTKSKSQLDAGYTDSQDWAANDLGNSRTYSLAAQIAYWTDSNGTHHNFTNRWQANTTGLVNGQTRKIRAELSKYDINNAITAQGTVGNSADCKPDGSATVSGTCEQNATFSFESVFNGWSYTQLCQAAQTNGTLTLYPNSIDCTQVDPPPANPAANNGYSHDVLSGMTIIQFGKNQQNVDVGPGSGIVVIDARTTRNSNPVTNITYNVSDQFNGIIWVIGDAKITAATGTIHGAVFVTGTINPLNGDSTVVYDAAQIEAALGNLGNSFTNQSPHVVSWEEI